MLYKFGRSIGISFALSRPLQFVYCLWSVFIYFLHLFISPRYVDVRKLVVVRPPPHRRFRPTDRPTVSRPVCVFVVGFQKVYFFYRCLRFNIKYIRNKIIRSQYDRIIHPLTPIRHQHSTNDGSIKVKFSIPQNNNKRSFYSFYLFLLLLLRVLSSSIHFNRRNALKI